MIGVSIEPNLQTLTGASAGPMNPPPDPGAGGGDPAPAPAALAITPAARWHPEFSTVTETAGRVTNATDLTGLAAVSASGPGLGPKAMVDATGRKFWRFEGYEYLNVANTLTLSTRDMAVFMVGRFHRVSNKCPVFSLGSVQGANPANTLGAALEASILSRSAPMLRGYSYPRNSTYTGAEWMVAGSQLQVVGAAGRATADGGTGLWINDHMTNTTQPYSVSGVSGAEIGRYAKSPGTAGNWGTFDLYEMIICDAALTDAEGTALSADLMAHYGIIPVANQLILEGDSIMQGTDDVTTGVAASMALTEPNAGLIGANWRVVNMASSGNQVSNLIQRRDASSGWPILKLPGENVMAVEIGRNDFGSGGRSAASHYANVVAYLNTTTTGILNRGWSARVLANIASGSSFAAKITAYRALLRDPAFLTDTGTGTGQTYAGKLSVVDTDLVTDGGNTIFATTPDAGDTTYYVGDSTHLNTLGTALRMSGGDDPAMGVAYGL